MKNAKLFFIAIIVIAGAVAGGESRSGILFSGSKDTLLGRWTAGCKTDSNGGGSITNYEFDGDGNHGTVAMDSEVYASRSCNHSQLIARERLIGRYGTKSGKLITDFSHAKNYSTYYDSKVVAKANRARKCGAGDWKVGVERMGCSDLPVASAASIYSVHQQTLKLVAGNESMELKLVR